MLIWLNGPFGVGKTSAAEALIERLRCAALFDPEPVGSMLRHLLGSVEPVDDFQDLAAWRAAVPALVRILRQSHTATLVMPMTIWRRDYFIELAGALQAADGDLRCYRLTACEHVLRARILGRDPVEGSRDWCLAHLTSGLAMMRDPFFGEEVATSDRSPPKVAELIVATLPELSRANTYKRRPGGSPLGHRSYSSSRTTRSQPSSRMFCSMRAMPPWLLSIASPDAFRAAVGLTI